MLLRLLTPGLACLLCACTGMVHFQAKPLTADKVAAAYRQRTPGSVGLPQGRALTFADLSKAAMDQHPEVELARAEADTAKAAITTADVRPNPVVGFNPTRVTPQESGLSPWVAGFTLDVPLETAGKRRLRVQQALHASNAAALRVTDTAWQVRDRLRKAWLDLYAATQRLALIKAQLATQQDTAASLETRVKAGESSRPELMQSRLLLNQTRLLQSAAEKATAEARADVATALGLPVAQLEGVTFDFGALDKPSATVTEERLRRAAMTQRSDVLAALADYAAAESTLQLEIAKQYPDVHLGPGYEFDQGPNKWTLGLSVTLPVFDKNRGPIAEAEAKRQQAAAKVNVLMAKITGSLDHALASYHGAQQQLHTAEETLAESAKQVSAANALRQGGEGDRLAVLTAQVEQQAAGLARLEALVEVQRALAALEDAAHLPLMP